MKSELEKAKKASQKPPLSVEVDECRKFIARSEKCLADLDRERESEQSALTDAKVRLQRLEAEQTAPSDEAPVPADWKAQMEALQAQVTAMREERDQGPVAKRQAVGHIPSRNNGIIPPMPTFVPVELDNWMQDLQLDLQNRCGPHHGTVFEEFGWERRPILDPSASDDGCCDPVPCDSPGTG